MDAGKYTKVPSSDPGNGDNLKLNSACDGTSGTSDSIVEL